MEEVMKKTMIAAGAAGLLAASSSVALAEEVNGLITAIDANAASVTLNNGKVYFLPQSLASLWFKIGEPAKFQVGQNVIVTFTVDSNGKMMASDVKTPD
jgi:hypothetical protein